MASTLTQPNQPLDHQLHDAVRCGGPGGDPNADGAFGQKRLLGGEIGVEGLVLDTVCLLYTSDAADE